MSCLIPFFCQWTWTLNSNDGKETNVTHMKTKITKIIKTVISMFFFQWFESTLNEVKKTKTNHSYANHWYIISQQYCVYFLFLNSVSIVVINLFILLFFFNELRREIYIQTETCVKRMFLDAFIEEIMYNRSSIF